MCGGKRPQEFASKLQYYQQTCTAISHMWTWAQPVCAPGLVKVCKWPQVRIRKTLYLLSVACQLHKYGFLVTKCGLTTYIN